MCVLRAPGDSGGPTSPDSPSPFDPHRVTGCASNRVVLEKSAAVHSQTRPQSIQRNPAAKISLCLEEHSR
ncbi:uncharacterized protein TRAVEDRAFT_30452 [Trametes versicolor FP-101664 SS1]|uniref:uncharacterized protein n=1 Tax=Trametes versicolor (strain FP-101664) TaxID=717944 RepID=UPI0004622DD5|nr:uncharacterized protein TRAVEDRAFT_30452 [Trametes versicolor FP-101664 SS1]EIW55700.1 hypothetical protein TRAVEDRAFT_30452 [Trametes versicolor FP-101664 SS1]